MVQKGKATDVLTDQQLGAKHFLRACECSEKRILWDQYDIHEGNGHKLYTEKKKKKNISMQTKKPSMLSWARLSLALNIFAKQWQEELNAQAGRKEPVSKCANSRLSNASFLQDRTPPPYPPITRWQSCLVQQSKKQERNKDLRCSLPYFNKTKV